MLRLLLVTWWSWCGVASAKVPRGSFLELSPLRSALGFISVRTENDYLPTVSFGGFYEYQRVDGQNQFDDETYHFGLEALHYPEETGFDGMFVGVGLSYARFFKGHRRLRDYSTDIQYTAEGQYDTWASDQHALLMPVFCGYRLITGAIFTASIRLSWHELLYSDVSIVERDISSYDFSPEKEVSGSSSSEVAVYFGVDFG